MWAQNNLLTPQMHAPSNEENPALAPPGRRRRKENFWVNFLKKTPPNTMHFPNRPIHALSQITDLMGLILRDKSKNVRRFCVRFCRGEGPTGLAFAPYGWHHPLVHVFSLTGTITHTMNSASTDTQPLPPTTAALALVPLGVLLNLGIGTIVHLLKLPLFVDAVGTILVTLLIGWRWGALTGVLSFLVGGILTNPVLPWFCGTQAVVAIVAGLLAARGWFKSIPKTIGESSVRRSFRTVPGR